jgi:hypothetical protein
MMRDIGERPQRDHYNHHATHRYPPADIHFSAHRITDL